VRTKKNKEFALRPGNHDIELFRIRAVLAVLTYCANAWGHAQKGLCSREFITASGAVCHRVVKKL